MKDGSVTFGWFVHNRYYPLRDWRPETEKVKKIQIERDLVEKFESVSLDAFEPFTLQKHLKHLATFLSEDRVKHARSYLKSIFAEAVFTITETVYKGKIRPFGKTKKSLGNVLLPKGVVEGLWLWKEVCSDSSPDAFIFPNSDGGFTDTGNYRNRVLTPLMEKLGLPKLNFQVLRRTMATLAQSKDR